MGQIWSFCFKLNLDEVAIFKEQFPITNQLNALGNLFEEVLFMIAAHNKMASRNEAVMAIPSRDGGSWGIWYVLHAILAERFPWSFWMGKHHGRSIVQEAYTAYGYELWSLLKKKTNRLIIHFDRQNPNLIQTPAFAMIPLLSCHHFPSPPQRKKVCARHARRGDGWWSSSKDLRD